MNHVRIATAVALMILLAALPGCSSKKDKAEQAPPSVQTPQQGSMTSSKAGKAATPTKAPVTIEAKDDADTLVLREKVLKQLLAQDFAGIYKEASDGFRKVGTEKQFVALWQKQLQQTGPIKEAKEVTQVVRSEDKALGYIYKVQYEKASKSVRLIFGRNKDGKMELIGINQRDPK
jgi:hypothetical protein